MDTHIYDGVKVYAKRCSCFTRKQCERWQLTVDSFILSPLTFVEKIIIYIIYILYIIINIYTYIYSFFLVYYHHRLILKLSTVNCHRSSTKMAAIPNPFHLLQQLDKCPFGGSWQCGFCTGARVVRAFSFSYKRKISGENDGIRKKCYLCSRITIDLNLWNVPF